MIDPESVPQTAGIDRGTVPALSRRSLARPAAAIDQESSRRSSDHRETVPAIVPPVTVQALSNRSSDRETAPDIALPETVPRVIVLPVTGLRTDRRVRRHTVTTAAGTMVSGPDITGARGDGLNTGGIVIRS